MLIGYLIIGLIYVILNGLVRKIYQDEGDWLLVLIHWFMWPFFACIYIGKGLWFLLGYIIDKKAAQNKPFM